MEEITTYPKVEIEEELMNAVLRSIEEEKQVIVHIQLLATEWPMGIRIWPSTFLIPQGGGHKAKLQHLLGISMAPTWTYMSGDSHSFTLIFEGLPKDCQVFDLIEDIDSPGRFAFLGIVRNQSDVYHINSIV